MLDLLDRICANGITGVSITGQCVRGIVDGVALVTDAQATPESLANSYFFLSLRNQHDQSGRDALHQIL